MINDILDLSKVEAGKIEFFPEEVNLPALISESIQFLTTEAQAKKITIEADISPLIDQVFIDPVKFKQILYNYLSNALKFTLNGGKIRVRVRPEGQYYFRVEVEDSGIGIAEHDIGKLFSEFQQLDSGYSKRHQGTGLGLALTKRLADAQGGGVGVNSSLGKGSIFYVILPIDLRRINHESRTSGQNSRKILVIEEPDDLRISRALQNFGFSVITASTLKHAVDYAEAKAFGSITIDIGAENLRALEAVDSIRETNNEYQAPVKAMMLKSAGANIGGFSIANIISKPAKSKEIIATLRNAGLLNERSWPNKFPTKVLVIDDDEKALDLMSAILTSCQLDVTCIKDSSEVLISFEKHIPDAIILDLMMPVIDGFQLLALLQEREVLKKIPVFIWTSMILTEEEYRLLKQSAQAILSKGQGQLKMLLDDLHEWSNKTWGENN